MKKYPFKNRYYALLNVRTYDVTTEQKIEQE